MRKEIKIKNRIIGEDRPLCIIPARGGSKRFPRKNIAILAGKPLIAYAIETALESDVFAEVCVSSDDDEILSVSRRYGATMVLKRPDELSGDEITTRQVCTYLLNERKAHDEEYKEFSVLLATSPLRTAEDIREAYRIFKQENANYVKSVVPFSHPPQRAVWVRDGFLEPYFGYEYMINTQQLDQVYRHDGSITFAKTEVFLNENTTSFGTKVVPYFMPIERSVDIDNEIDLEWAEFMLKRSKKQ